MTINIRITIDNSCDSDFDEIKRDILQELSCCWNAGHFVEYIFSEETNLSIIREEMQTTEEE